MRERQLASEVVKEPSWRIQNMVWTLKGSNRQVRGGQVNRKDVPNGECSMGRGV